MVDEASIEALAKAHPDVVADLRKVDRITTAATFAGLLAIPELQANCLRLEYLVHLAVAYGGGRAQPTQGFVRRSFERLGTGYCGMAEDPAENLFVALVNTPRGNFRVFEGIREGNAFHLQRILNLVERMPRLPPFMQMRDSIDSILRLSDAVAARKGLVENNLGEPLPVDALPKDVYLRLSSARDLIRFGQEDFDQFQIVKEHLSQFTLPRDSAEIRAQSPGHTALERCPVALDRNWAYLLLPTAVGSAIARFVIETALSMGLADAFELALTEEFSTLLRETPILGGRTAANIEFQRIAGGQIGTISKEIDPGRFLNLIFFVDGLDDFAHGGVCGQNSAPEALASAVNAVIIRAAAGAGTKAGFRGGISLVVAGGFGRTISFPLEESLPQNWRLEFIAAHDLVTLSWLSGFDALSLWRLLDAREAIEQQGVTLMNLNGLLNLVAWSRHLRGHLVPHRQIPDRFVEPTSESMLWIPQDMIRDLRYEVAAQWNPRRVPDSDGRWIKVRKLDKTEFAEDNFAPLYASEEDIVMAKLRGVYVASRRPWWVEIAAPENAPGGSVFAHWRLLCVWLGRAAPVLDLAYSGLPSAPVSFRVSFDEVAESSYGALKAKGEDELRSLITILTESGSSRIQIDVAKGFDDGLSQPENVAERVLVEALVAGAAQAGGEITDEGKRARLVKEICSNSQARWMHRFESRSFREEIGPLIGADPLLIDQIDDANSRIGLGWRARSRAESPDISGIPECTAYLNDIVRVILDELCEELKTLDRRGLVTALLHNHETAAHDRDRWKRTAQAQLALRNDKAAAVQTIIEHHGRLNACFTASRILMEAAICECPLLGGQPPGRLDVSRAMARAMLAYYLGGSSDAIHWKAAEAIVRITPLGDVHMEQSFMDTVYEPFGKSGAEADVKRAVESYEKLYAGVSSRSVADVFSKKFLDAWAAEFGVSLDGALEFLAQLEDKGRQPPQAVLMMQRSALAAMLSAAAEVSPHDALNALDWVTLTPRQEWRKVNDEFRDKDWYPWRFRRRLCVLRRPLIQIDNESDPTIAIAPGLMGESLRAMVGWFHSGEIPSSQARSLEMRRWIGHANNVQRLEFNSSVADRMRELGWQVEKEVKLTGLLGRPLDRNYGDIDVLAWRPETGRVLLMECKDLQYNKTLGEVAEQLSDFRGEVAPDGKPDHLKRHLDRLDVLADCEDVISQKLKLLSPINLEGHLVFRNPVPMRFAWDRMAKRVRLSLFTELDLL